MDTKTRDYVAEVHAAFRRKALEISALRARLEPAVPRTAGQKAQSRKTALPPATAETRRHVDHRYDVGLSTLRGYAYSPRRAYFQRDSDGTGRLLFEPGISLLLVEGGGATAAEGEWELPNSSRDDRWWGEWHRRHHPRRQGGGVEPPSGPYFFGAPPEVRRAHSRMARLDAFLAMFERRQALTQLAGAAPTCVFVGERFERPAQRHSLYPQGTQRPPRLERHLIPQHRYLRFCVSMALVTARGELVTCLVLAERAWPGEPFRLHALVARDGGSGGEAPPLDVAGELEPEILRQWNLLAMHAGPPYHEYPVFDAPLYPFPQGRGDAGLTVVEAPHGDGDLVFRAGLLLESPRLDYVPGALAQPPWDTENPFEGPAGLIRAVPIDVPEFRGAFAGPRAPQRLAWLWMRYVLMLRTYPYALLAHHDMLEVQGLRPHVANANLTRAEVQRFQDAIQPGEGTTWFDMAAYLQRRAKKAQRRRGPPASTAAVATERDVRPRPSGAPYPPGPGRDDGDGDDGGDDDDETALALARDLKPVGNLSTRRRRVPPGPLPGRLSSRCSVRNATHSSALVAEARFLAIRCAEDAVNFRDPLYAAQDFTKDADATKVARGWRKALLRSLRPTTEFDAVAEKGADLPDVLWILGAQALDWIYGRGARAVWARKPRLPPGALPQRAEWGQDLIRLLDPGRRENREPFASTRYRSLWRVLPSENPSSKDIPIGDPNSLDLLHGIAVNVVPKPRGSDEKRGFTYGRRGEFHTIMAATVLSLIKEGLLFLAPSPEHYRAMGNGRLFDPAYTPTGLRARIQAWYADRQADLAQPLGAFPNARGRAALHPLASLAILAWEWGKFEGLRRYLNWVDALWLDKFPYDTAPPRISSRLVRTYRVILELVHRNTGKGKDLLRRPSAPPTPASPKEEGEEEEAPKAEEGAGEGPSVDLGEFEEGASETISISLGDLGLPATPPPEESVEKREAREAELAELRVRVTELDRLLEFVEGLHGYDRGALDRELGTFAREQRDPEVVASLRHVEAAVEGLPSAPGSATVYAAPDAYAPARPVAKSRISVTFRRAGAPAESPEPRPANARLDAAAPPRRRPRRKKRWSVDAVDTAMARLRALRHRPDAQQPEPRGWEV